MWSAGLPCGTLSGDEHDADQSPRPPDNQVAIMKMTMSEAFRMARKAVRVSQRLVAEVAEVSRPTVSAIERKGREPRLGELRRVASLFRMSPELLMQADFGKTRERFVEASFRTNGEGGLDVQDRWELHQVEDDLGTSPPFAPISGAEAKPVPAASDAIRRGLGVSEPSPIDLFQALYVRNYNLVFTALSSISGALVRDGRGRCAIVVSSDQPDDRQRWTAAHELAHLACGHDPQNPQHVDLYGPSRLRADQEADLLAAELLMPMEEVRERLVRLPAVTPPTMYALAADFHVSYTAMIFRCSALSLISSRQVEDLRQAKPSEIEGELRLKAGRATAFSAGATVPRVESTLVADGRLPGGWERDFSLSGALHLRRLQAEAIREYVTQVTIQDRQTSVTEVFEQVAGWVAETYPWGT